MRTILREGDQLQIEIRRHAALHVQQRLHRQQAVIAHVDMAADREQAARHGPIAVLQRALHQGILRQLRFQFPPQRNAFQQGAGLVHARQAVTERRIHMEVGIDERRRQQAALRIDFARALGLQSRSDIDDAALVDGDIDALASVGQIGIADDQLHRLTPEVGDGRL
jgi:hypothetical protein